MANSLYSSLSEPNNPMIQSGFNWNNRKPAREITVAHVMQKKNPFLTRAVLPEP